MKNLLFTIAATVLLLFPSTAPTSAQTASETVAFILFGMEDGRTVLRTKGQFHVRQTSSDPSASYDISYSGGASGKKKVTVSPAGTCNFNVEIIDEKNATYKSQYNFAHLASASRLNLFFSINFNGQCPIKYLNDDKCETTHLMLPEYGISYSRLQKAIDYYKSSFCAGSAF